MGLDELLHLSERETLRIVSEADEELEVEATWQPGGSAPPLHLHPAQDEEFIVHAGQLTAVVGGKEHQLGAGDTLCVPRGTPHKMWNSGPEPAGATWRTRPALRTAEWFRTIDRLGAGGTRRPPLPELAKAVQEYADVFRLAAGPGWMAALVPLALRLLAAVQR